MLQSHRRFGISYGIAIFFVVSLGLISFTESAYALSNISTCQSLSVPGETYALTSDITATGGCFDITADGITLEGNGYTITGDGTGFGVEIISATGVTIQNLEISNFVNGIFMDNSHVNTITNNIISQTSYGVNFGGASSNNLISGNFFYNNVNGVHSWPSSSNSNTITLNTFFKSGHEQVQWHDTNGNNLVYHNNFLEPIESQIVDECIGCTNQYSVPSGGNYYDTYDEPSEGCNDVNLDGFCDDPYIILDQFGAPNAQDDLPFVVQNGWDLSPNPDPDPYLVVPDDMIIGTGVASGATVAFSSFAIDGVDGIISATCNMTSGSNFPLGNTEVTCSATDSAGNSVSRSFTITVQLSSNLTLTIKAIDNNGITRNMWNGISQGGTAIGTGFTPKSYQVTTGVEYTAFVGEFGTFVFDHWEDGSTDSSRPITLTQDTTITAFMLNTAMGDIIPPVVSASPTSGTIVMPVDVTLSATDNFDPTPTIHYTMDGSTPTTASPLYTVPITIASTTTLNFIAVDSSGNVSPVSTENYIMFKTLTINSVDMVGDPFPGFYTTIHEGGILIDSGFTPMTFVGTGGSTYTVETQDYVPWLFGNWEDGSAVTARQITLNSDTTLTASYMDSTGDVTAPIVSASSPGGNYVAPVDVTLSAIDDIDPTPTIYFTMDGSTPTLASPLYFASIPITAATTLNFIAVDAIGNISDVSTEVYVFAGSDVTAPIVSASPAGGIFVNSVDVTLSATDDTDPAPIIHYTTDGSPVTTASSVYTGPITITADTTLNFMSIDAIGNASAESTASYLIIPPTAATLTVTSVDLAGDPFPGFYTTIHEGGTLVQTGFTPLTFIGTIGTTYTVETQDYLNWLFGNWEDGSTVAARQITLNSDTTLTASYMDSTGDVTAPIVSASSPGGTYINSVDVILSAIDDIDPTPTIYFTMDGSIPTTASPLYFASIPITAATTLNFIAVDAVGNISDVSTEVYVITTSTTSELTVLTKNSSGEDITGYWTIILQGVVELQMGFSPQTFILNNGETYEVYAGNYQGVIFDHWEDGSTVNPRTFSITSDTTFTAFYLP